ncbi:MAG TPA: trypsin-like peptidase domain-containing protein [Gaiellaceae bacterium]|jgi:S1-C subfamily serine protease|nr:trypsin-like peptidase domain-containing protein [Gaiellaceae bacterium]
MSPARFLCALVVLAASAIALVHAREGDAGSAAPSAGHSLVQGIVDVRISLSFGRLKAAGTGIVLTSDGVVLTNNHVIREATVIRVRDVDNDRSYAASVLGYDIRDDVAVLRLHGASGLVTARLGAASSLGVGDAVSAYGNALGAGGTPRRADGTVTRLNATAFVHYADGSTERLTKMIESNTDTLPGDSGGPLVDGHGRVVGINTAGVFGAGTVARSEAIPLAKALAVEKAVRAGRASPRIHVGTGPWLGVLVEGPDSDRHGVTVAEVSPGSPAERAGLVRGDILVTCNHRLLVHPNDLANVLFEDGPGTRVPIAWIDRMGSSRSATVTLGRGTPQ